MRHIKIPAILLGFILILTLFPAAALAAPAEEETPAPEVLTTVKIYHTNDVHGHAASDTQAVGYARMQTYIKQDEADGKLILDAGDAFHGNNFAALSKGQSIAEIMRAVGYDAFVPGRHDFTYGLPILQELIEQSGADALSVNLTQNGVPVFEPYHIYTAGGMKIGIVGISSPEVVADSNASSMQGIDTLGGELMYQKAQEAVDEMLADGVNAVIALTHLGIQTSGETSSVDLATHVTGIDLIVDGNAHLSYPNGYTDYPGYVQGQTPVIVQAASSFDSFGVTDLVFDENRQLVGIVPSAVNTQNLGEVVPDKTVSNLINTYDQEQQTFLERVVAATPVLLNGEREYVRTGATNLSTLVTDAMLDATGADIALLSSSALRTSIPEGDITAAEINNVLPSGDYVMTTTISGAELKKILNEHMILGGETFPQFSGIHVTAQKYLTPDGVYAGRILSVTRNGAEVQDSDLLSIAVTDNLYDGHSGYLLSGLPVGEYDTLYNIVSEYLAGLSPEELAAIPQSAQLTMLETTIDADSLIEKLEIQIPVDIRVDLTQSAVVPENVLYSLIGQDRDLVFSVQGEYPYSFIFDGEDLESPANVSLDADVSQTPSPSRRTASTADKNAFFVDLSDNRSLPPTSYIQVDVGGAYPPGSTVYIYFYDQNDDILPYEVDGLTVSDDGTVTFPVTAGSAYLLNSRLLNAATSFELPSPERPYQLGILILCVAFAVWVVFFLITKKGCQNKKRP